MMKIAIIGAKNPETGRMIDAIVASGSIDGVRDFEFSGFVDNDEKKKGTRFLDLPVIGGFEAIDDLVARDFRFINTITGSTRSRYETTSYVRSRGGQFVNFIHPSVSSPENLGTGNYIQEHVIIQAAVRIGDNSSIHTAAIVAHECVIGSSSFIAHGVSLSGEVTVGDGVFVGTHATVLPRLKIGNWATIGAGAVVLKDVPAYGVVVGNPAKLIRLNEAKYENGQV